MICNVTCMATRRTLGIHPRMYAGQPFYVPVTTETEHTISFELPREMLYEMLPRTHGFPQSMEYKRDFVLHSPHNRYIVRGAWIKSYDIDYDIADYGVGSCEMVADTIAIENVENASPQEYPLSTTYECAFIDEPPNETKNTVIFGFNGRVLEL